MTTSHKKLRQPKQLMLSIQKIWHWAICYEEEILQTICPGVSDFSCHLPMKAEASRARLSQINVITVGHHYIGV